MREVPHADARVAVVAQPLRFPGQYADRETGLSYNRHRYYSSAEGRFVTQDPIRLAGGLNVGAYARNPVAWVDPLGLNPCGIEGGTPGQEALPAPQGSNPWMRGTVPTAGPVPSRAMEIEMAIATGQVRPGGWGTLDHIPDVNAVHNDLAAIPESKPDVSHVQTFLIPAGTQVQVGVVGPQTSTNGTTYPGGRNQVQILSFADRANVVPVGPPRPIR